MCYNLTIIQEEYRVRFNRVFFKLFVLMAIPILVIQPSYTSIALATEKLPKQIKNIEVPPLYQNQATSSAAKTIIAITLALY